MTHNRYRLIILLFCGLLFIQIPPFSANAGPSSGDQWEFQLAPYAWLAGQNGKVATLPGLPPADVDVDFYDDIWGNINLAGMLVGEARKGRYGLFMDIVYMGHDTFKIKDQKLVRTFPIYNQGDTNKHPTGGTRRLVYGLYPGEAMWQLKVEKSETLNKP